MGLGLQARKGGRRAVQRESSDSEEEWRMDDEPAESQLAAATSSGGGHDASGSRSSRMWRIRGANEVPGGPCVTEDSLMCVVLCRRVEGGRGSRGGPADRQGDEE